MQFPSRAIWVTSLKSLSTYVTCLLIELCQIVWPFERIISYAHDQDHVHIHSHAILLHLENSKYIHPSTNKTPCCTMSISLQSYHHNVWAIQKEIKDAYPKKVCHMPTRQVKKKREEKRCIPKEGMPHTHKVWQKKRENIAIPNIIQGRESSYKRVPSIIHQKYPHTCTSWSRLMTCFSFGSGLWLSKIWEAGCLYILHTYRYIKKNH